MKRCIILLARHLIGGYSVGEGKINYTYGEKQIGQIIINISIKTFTITTHLDVVIEFDMQKWKNNI